MAEQFITCPHCGRKIQLTEAFTHEIEDNLRREFDTQEKKKEKDHEQALKAKDKELEEKLAKEKARFESLANKHAEESVKTELKDLGNQLEEKDKRLEEARNQELKLRKRQRVLEEKEMDLKLEIERTLDKERKKIWEEATAKVDEERRLKDREKDLQMESMRKQIDELKRKAEQGSQQAQGEAQELELEDVLKENFRFDEIRAVAKGIRGADVLQNVHTPGGQHCGSILWESKRSKNWSDSWLQKLKDDQRVAKAEIAVLVSETLPKEISHIGQVNGVWVTDFSSVAGLSTALRSGLVQVAQARSALVGKSEKMDLIYNYLSGPEFKRRVEGIIEPFVAMKKDLDSERRAMEKVWAKREKQIQRVIQNTTGMYGDLQGIAGATLPEIKILELPGAEDTENSDSNI